MHKKWMAFAVALGLLGSALGARAQSQDSRLRKEQVEVYVQQNGPEGAPKIETGDGNVIFGNNSVFVATELSFGGRVVKGAPYSAQAVTESVQTLADGNRIVHKSTAQVYRDSEGRTRRDQTIAAIGPYSVAGDPPQTYFINDPVAGVTYILDPRSKVARKMVTFELKQGPGDKESTFTIAPPPPPPGAPAAKEGEAHTFVLQTNTPTGEGVEFQWSKAEAKTEKLEARAIEGVQAEGTRTTTTIPAGAVGNEQPIQIVNENWYSPELQVFVMTTHSDPRFGTTTYKLTNIQRAEPAATLFQVPADYTVKDGPNFGVRTMRRERRPVEPPPQQQQEN
jgi:hypothetical protein